MLGVLRKEKIQLSQRWLSCIWHASTAHFAIISFIVLAYSEIMLVFAV